MKASIEPLPRDDGVPGKIAPRADRLEVSDRRTGS